MSALNAFSYGLASLYNNFTQIYVREYHDIVTTGLLLSIGPLVAIFAPFFWGVLADRAHSRKSVYFAMTAGSAVGFAMLGLSRSFPAMAISMLVFMFFFSPLTGLNDLLSVEGCAVSGANYGFCRVFGTLFYGLLPLIIAPITSGDINFIFVVYGVVSALCAVSAFPVPEKISEKHSTLANKIINTTDSAKKVKSRPFFIAMLCDRKLVMMVLMFFVAHFSFGCVLVYYPDYLTKQLGLPQSAWAGVVLATVAGEVPLFLFYNKIVNRFGLNRMLAAGVILNTMRMATYTFFKSALPIIGLSIITGFGITLITYSILIYVTDNYGRNRRATAMNFSYGFGVYGARVLAGVAAGQFVSLFGVPALMLAACVMSVASLIFFFIYRAGGPTAPPRTDEAEVSAQP
jgi:Major Facilitator Superfamily.